HVETGLGRTQVSGRNQREQLRRLVPAGRADVLLDFHDGPAQRLHAGTSPVPELSACSAPTASCRVATFTSWMPPTSESSAAAQFGAGTRKTVAPSERAPAIFCWMPPIAPTVPVASIVPVPATCRPPSSSPGVSLS